MATWFCGECTTEYSVGAPRCPHCGAVDPIREAEQLRRESEMPKITVAGGPSDAVTGEGLPENVETEEVDGDEHYYEQGGDVETLASVGNAGNGDGDEEDPDGDKTPEVVDYNAFTVEELRAELKDRELATSGNKPELVARLVEDDEAHADEAENVSAQAGVAAGTGEAGASA